MQNKIKPENEPKGLCLICDKPLPRNGGLICMKCRKSCGTVEYKSQSNDSPFVMIDVKSDCCDADIGITRRITCSPECHEVFVTEFEKIVGAEKEVVDGKTGKTHLVPVRLIIEKGVSYEELPSFPVKEEAKNDGE